MSSRWHHKQTAIETLLLRFFLVLRWFLYHYMYNCFGLNGKSRLFCIFRITGTKQAEQPIGWAASPALSCQQSYTLTTVRSWRIATTSWEQIASLAEYTVSASYGAPAAGSSIPKRLSSRASVAVLEVSLRKNSLCDFWLRLSQAVSIFASKWRFWIQLGPE